MNKVIYNLTAIYTFGIIFFSCSSLVILAQSATTSSMTSSSAVTSSQSSSFGTSQSSSSSSNMMMSPSSATTSIMQVKTSEFSGDVVKTDSSKLTLKSDTETKEFAIPNGVKITKNTNITKLDDINPNDKVKVIYNSSTNEVLSVEATSGEIFDTSKYAIPLAILLLLLIGLVWYFLNKRNKGHIKTTNSKVI